MKLFEFIKWERFIVKSKLYLKAESNSVGKFIQGDFDVEHEFPDHFLSFQTLRLIKLNKSLYA